MDTRSLLTSEQLLQRIGTASDYEMDELIIALRQRYNRLHPDSEILFLSFPKHDIAERAALWQWLLDYLRKYEQIDLI